MTPRAGLVRFSSVRGVVGCATIIACVGFAPWPAALAQSGPASHSDLEATARRLLRSYDAAWAARDIDRLIAPFSPKFGCHLYGGVDYPVMRQALESMVNDVLRDARCSTRVLRSSALENTVQALVIREYHDGRDTLLERQWQVFYLEPERAKDQPKAELKIVALEEFDPETLDQLQEQRYVGRISGLTFTLPRDLFVSLPPCPSSVDRILLRTPDLNDEITIQLRCFADPFEVEERLMAEYDDWAKGRDADLLVRGRITLAEARGARIDAKFSGPSCQLQSAANQTMLDRKLVRIYVAPDPRVLLAIELDAGFSGSAALEKKLDVLLASLAIREPGSASDARSGSGYGDRLMARLGLGPLDGNRFSDADSGLQLSAPPGFSLRRVPSENCFALEARSIEARGTESLRIKIDGIHLNDTSLDLDYFAAFEDLHFADQCDAAGETRPTIHRSSGKKGDLPLLRVERAIEGDAVGRDRVQLAVYLKITNYLVVFECSVRREDRAHAEKALDGLVARLTAR